MSDDRVFPAELPHILVEMFERDDVVIESEDLAYVGQWKVEKLDRGWGAGRNWDCQRHPGAGIIPSHCDHVMAVRVELQKARFERRQPDDQ